MINVQTRFTQAIPGETNCPVCGENLDNKVYALPGEDLLYCSIKCIVTDQL